MIERDELALLATSFAGAIAQATSPQAADAELYELGWADLLGMAPRQGAGAAFAVLGTTGSPIGLLDDVVAHSLGLSASPAMCVVMPQPNSTAPAGTMAGTGVAVDGLISARRSTAELALVPVLHNGTISIVAVAMSSLEANAHFAIDPSAPFVRVTAESAAIVDRVEVTNDWPMVVANAQAALAHQLIAASREMLEMARQHAVDRVQFGRAIASFQAVRHKLAEVFVATEGSAAVANSYVDGECDPMIAMLAKSLAGKAARLACANCQQVLAGIGFTTDHAFHLTMKRTMVLDTIFGSSRTLPADIGRALVATGHAPRLVEL